MTGRAAPRRRRNQGGTTGAIFGRNLRRFCKSRSLTVEVVAKRLGTGRKRAERLLSGDLVPGLALIGKISRNLKAPLEELLRGL